MAIDRVGGMGNASGKAELENGNGSLSTARKDGDASIFAGASQFSSVESMAETPQLSPRRLRSPFFFATQVVFFYLVEIKDFAPVSKNCTSFFSFYILT